MTAAVEASGPRGEGASLAAAALRWSSLGLGAVAWLSAAIFGAYIVIFYGGAVPAGAMEEWNATLPRLYEPQTPLATVAIGAHFLTGGIILLAGPIQLIAELRGRARALHRWVGRAYVAAAGLAGLGGLGFIAAKGTIGGAHMDIGFGLYGALTLTAAVQAYRHARARRFEAHRAWAIRLFALAVGSWLYRMDYGFWLVATDGLGHTRTFDGWFDVVMSFFFYVPNLIVAELFIRARRGRAGPVFQAAAAGGLVLATLFLAFATFQFAWHGWGPAIAHRLTGAG